MHKVLIVEDEAGIREGLVNAYDWNKMGCEVCGLAATGIEALEMCLLLKPDIVISDIVMPGIDGLALLEHIKKKNPEINFIILTGHREFDYAKNALNLGAEFFLLKPINYEELELTIQKLSDNINNKDREKEILTEKEYILHEIIRGKILHKKELSFQGQLFLKALERYCVCTLKFDDDNQDDFMRNQQLLQFCRNQSTKNAIVHSVDNQSITYLFCLNERDDYQQDLRQYFQLLQEKVNQFFKVAVSVGISEVLSGYEYVKNGFIQSIQALGYKFYSGNNSINFYLDLNRMEHNHPEHTDYYSVIRYCYKTIDLLKYRTGLELNKAGMDLFDEFIVPLKRSSSFVKASVLVLCMLCIQKVIGENHNYLAILLEKHVNFQNIETSNSLESLRDIYVNLLLDLSDYLNVKTSNKQEILQKAVEFIQDNYKSNLTLSDIAKKVYLSPSYLSTLFANELGKNYTDVLNETRINNSITLLQESGMKISEIALAVGYNEPQYYVTVFKKYMGLTPRKYREMHLL